MFQLSGRSAASDMSAISSMRSDGISPIAAMNSSVVPGWSRTAAASARSSSWDDARDGTGLPSPSVCASPSDDDTPSAPARIDSWASSTIASICSPLAVPPTASSPITTRRMVEWPTRKPAFTPSLPSMRSSHSPNECQSHAGPACSEPRDMPSTVAIMRMR